MYSCDSVQVYVYDIFDCSLCDIMRTMRLCVVAMQAADCWSTDKQVSSKH